MRQRGFTLLEMLIAVAIFSMLGVASYNVLTTLQRSEVISRESSERLTEMQRAFTIMERDLSQMVSRQVRIDGEAPREEVMTAGRNLVESEDDGIVFTHLGWRNPRAVLPRSTLQGTAYRLRDNTLEKLHTLYVDPVIGTEPQVSPLLEGVSALRFQFYHNNQWQQGWEREGLPQAVRVELEHQYYGVIQRTFLIAGADDREENDAP